MQRRLQLEWRKNALTLVFASGSHKTGIGWKTLNGKFRLENRKHSGARKHTLRFPGGAKDYRAKGKDNAIVTPCRSVRGSTLGERKKRGGKKREKKKKRKEKLKASVTVARRNQKDNILACIMVQGESANRANANMFSRGHHARLICIIP